MLVAVTVPVDNSELVDRGQARFSAFSVAEMVPPEPELRLTVAPAVTSVRVLAVPSTVTTPSTPEAALASSCSARAWPARSAGHP